MKYAKFGRTGLDVSRIALGTWQLSGSWGRIDREAALATVRRAREEGINFFDTAFAYGFGIAEELLGTGLRDELDYRRDEVVLVTKGGVRKTSSGNVRDSSPSYLREGLESSLRSLGVEHVDIFLLHWPDEGTAMETVAGTVNEFVEEGKVRFVGASNFDTDQLKQISPMTDISVLQPGYSLLRRNVETSVLPYCRDQDIGVFVYGTLAHGLLTGKYGSDVVFDDEDWRSKSPVFKGESLRRNVEAVERLGNLANDLGYSLPELATAWTLAQPGVHSAIVGSGSADHVPEAASAGSIELTPEQCSAIEEIVADGVPIGGPSPEGGVPE